MVIGRALQGHRLVGWLVRRFTGPVVPFSEQGRTVARLTGLAIRHLSKKKLSAFFFTKSPTEGMALTGHPSGGAQAGVRAAGGDPPALGR